MRCSAAGPDPLTMTLAGCDMMKRWAPVLFLSLLMAAGCDTEAESAPESRRPSPGQPQNPWDTLPPEQVYGATPAENVRLTPVELDVLGLPAGWDGIRIAAISDFQLDLWSGNEAVAAAAVEAAAGTVLAMAHHPAGAHSGALGPAVHAAMIGFVALSAFGYASFALAGVLGLTYVLMFKEIKAKHLGFFYTRLPPLRVLDVMNGRAVAVGWVFLTTGVSIGAT